MRIWENLPTGALILAVCLGLAGPALSQQELEVEIDVGPHLLSGTLALPAGQGPFPAAVLISGSGRSDRDESLPGVPFRPFAQLAAELQAFGIATLRYDDRGVGRSTGDFHSATAFDFARDAEAAAAFLAELSEIDAAAIGLIGHSEGGMVAPIVAARNEDIAFVVSLAGTAVPGYQVFAGQLRDALATLPAEQREAVYASEIRSLDLTVVQNWPAIEQLLREEHAAMPAEQRSAAGSADEYVSRGMIYYRGWLHTFATHDPSADWTEVRAPVLAIFGGRDVQVRPDLNAPPLERALTDNGGARITILPTANHLFQDARTGEPDEYGTLPATFVAGFVQTIADFIRAIR